MESIFEEAFISAVKIENRSLEFYRAASLKVTDVRIKHAFIQLAKEEYNHLEALCNMCQIDEDELLEILSDKSMKDDSHYRKMSNSINNDLTEIEALQIALEEEEACIELYSEFVYTIEDPQIRDVFIRILNETRKHSETIAEEYMHHMKMAHMTDLDIYVRE